MISLVATYYTETIGSDLLQKNTFLEHLKDLFKSDDVIVILPRWTHKSPVPHHGYRHRPSWLQWFAKLVLL